MEHRTAPIVNLARSLIYFTLIILTTSVEATRAKNCYNRLDIVFAVDTTSSQSSSSFDQVKSEVKAIVSGFTVGQHKTRLALISMSKRAKVLLNFNAVNSLSDFNAAVDSLAFSTDVVDLSEGLRVAKESVLNTARSDKISKIVILVKDRRSINAAVSSASVLSRMTSRAAEVKSMGAKINVVGTGGLWNRQELGALFGSDYILFFKNSALRSVKSLNNKICAPICSKKAFKKSGLCYNLNKHVLEATVTAVPYSSGLIKCQKQIVRKFSACSRKETCFSSGTKLSSCKAGKVTITNFWKMFDHKSQSCKSFTDEQKVDCKDAMTCTGQVADVLFVLDYSGSVGTHFGEVKQTTLTLIESMNIGPNNVRVGVLRFSTDPMYDIPLGSRDSKSELVNAVGALPENPSGRTNTDRALKQARDIFASEGRQKVAKFVFLLTDGESDRSDKTFREAATIKNEGVTLYAIGIGSVNMNELSAMTAPETATNFIHMTDFGHLRTWARNFSRQLCTKMSDPNPKLCDNSVFLKSVSECTGGKQQITATTFEYDAARKCIKSTRSTIENSCKKKCIDPIDGNEYLEGETWTKLCHKFRCTGAKPLLPLKTKCPAADGTCKDVSSTPFKCRDENGVEHSNCRCVDQGSNIIALVF